MRDRIRIVKLACVVSAASAAWCVNARAGFVYLPNLTADITTNISDPNFEQGVGLDINGDGAVDVVVNAYAPGDISTNAAASISATGVAQTLLQPGDVVPFSGGFGSALITDLSNLTSTQFVGLEIIKNTFVVLAQISLTWDPNLQTLHVGNAGYEVFSQDNLTVVPEPGSLTALAVGAAGMLARRGRRKG